MLAYSPGLNQVITMSLKFHLSLPIGQQRPKLLRHIPLSPRMYQQESGWEVQQPLWSIDTWCLNPVCYNICSCFINSTFRETEMETSAVLLPECSRWPHWPRFIWAWNSIQVCHVDDRDQLLKSSLPATFQCEHYQEVRIGTKARAQTQAIPGGTVSVLTNVLFVGLKVHLLGHFFFLCCTSVFMPAL